MCNARRTSRARRDGARPRACPVCLFPLAPISGCRWRAQDVASPAVQVQPPQPGYYMRRARIVEMGPDGRPLYRVEAERLQQDPSDNSVQMNDLKLVYHSVEARDWTLTAAHGFVPPGSRSRRPRRRDGRTA